MPKFSQVPTNASPALADFLLGVSSGSVDQKHSLAVLAAFFGANIPAGTIKNTMVDFTTTGKIWWEELARVTLGAPADILTTPAFTARKYLHVLVLGIVTGGTVNFGMRFNGDTGNNYAHRVSNGGGADAVGVSQPQAYMDLGGAFTDPVFFIDVMVSNVQTQEKQMEVHAFSNNGNGAANAPRRSEWGDKWANTTAQITTVSFLNVAGTGDLATGTEIIVLGHD